MNVGGTLNVVVGGLGCRPDRFLGRGSATQRCVHRMGFDWTIAQREKDQPSLGYGVAIIESYNSRHACQRIVAVTPGELFERRTGASRQRWDTHFSQNLIRL